MQPETFDRVIAGLMNTGAFSVCEPDKPFFFSATKLSAYHIRSGNVCGSEAQAAGAFALLQTAKDTPLLCGEILSDYLDDLCKTSAAYALLTDAFAALAETVDKSSYDYICGTDISSWLFSFCIAERLQKPHLLISGKNLLYYDPKAQKGGKYHKSAENPAPANAAGGARVLFVSDILGRGGIFFKTWFPQLAEYDLTVAASVNIFDCLTGGSDRMLSESIPVHSLFELDTPFFNRILDLGLISYEQHAFVCSYASDPIKTMGDFVRANPEYIKKQE